MGKTKFSRHGLIAAERRRRIYTLALERGSINVTEVSKELGVNPDTIRRDLDELDKEKKLIRSHGGAIAVKTEVTQRHYSILRNENLQQKAWIGQAALKYLPETGSIWLGPGSTTYQMALNMPEKWPGHVITNSPEIAVYLASTKGISVSLLGGNIRMDSFSTDCSWSEHIFDISRWNVTFVSATSIDIDAGIGSIDVNAALMDRRILGLGKKLVLLNDSSKFGRFSYSKVGDVDLIDVLITDPGVSETMLAELKLRGVEVIIAGPDGVEQG